MRISSSLGGVAAALGLLTIAAPVVQAQFGIPLPHVAVGGVGSSLGFGGDVAIGLGRHIVVRAAKTVGVIGANRSMEEQSYAFIARADNRSLMVDLHPFGGGIYLSAGQVVNHSSILPTGEPANGSYIFNGQSYSADSVGTLRGAIRLPEKPMFFGLGWDHTFGNRWPSSVTSRFGVLHQERARLDLTATGPYGQASNPAHADFQTQLDAERTKQEQGLDNRVVRNLPVVEIGLRLRLF